MTKIEQFCSIDSLKLRLPMSEVRIIDTSILDTKTKYVISDISGEIISEDKIKSLTSEIKFNGYSIKVALISLYEFATKSTNDYLEIYLHSKILEHSYFEGMTSTNIALVYQRLMSANIFECSLNTFMNSPVNDIDIKLDLDIENNVFNELCKELNSRTTTTTKLGQGGKRYDNGNLTFNRRETSTLAKPFVKFYNKELEANEKNSEFFNLYIPNKLIKDKKRIEVTCKKSTDIRKYFHDNYVGNSLSSISEYPSVINLRYVTLIPHEKLLNYLCYAINQNISKPIKIAKSTIKNQSAIDIQIQIHFTNSITNQGMTFMQTLNGYLEHFEDKQMRMRMKKKCLEWNNKGANQSTNETTSNDILDILKLLNIE
jgi:hypothetical protein